MIEIDVDSFPYEGVSGILVDSISKLEPFLHNDAKIHLLIFVVV